MDTPTPVKLEGIKQIALGGFHSMLLAHNNCLYVCGDTTVFANTFTKQDNSQFYMCRFDVDSRCTISIQAGRYHGVIVFRHEQNAEFRMNLYRRNLKQQYVDISFSF
jgi:alpha-tubulin suppressor-like RCC1 family protein